MAINHRLTEALRRGWLAAVDPRLKLAALVWLLTLSVLVDSLAALAVLFALAGMLTSGLRLRPRGWLAVAGLLAVVAWGTLLGQALFYAELPRTTLATLVPPLRIGGWEFPGLRLYREGAWHGLAQSLRMLAMLLAGLAVSLSTSPERLLAALARMRLSPAVGFVTVAALRFLPTLATEWSTVSLARRLRGHGSRSSGRLTLPRRWLGLAAVQFDNLVPVLAASLRRAQALAVSVAARGFDPAARRTYYPALSFRPVEGAALALLVASGLAVVTAKLLYWLYQGELFYHPALRGLYEAVREWL